MLTAMLPGFFASVLHLHAQPAQLYSLDKGWKFAVEGSTPLAPCAKDAWSTSMDGKKTNGLTQAAAITEEHCAEECCADPSCEAYQFCNQSSCGS
jgi:hypothetical protein